MGGNVWQREGKAVSMHGSLQVRSTCGLQCLWEYGCVKDAVCFKHFSFYECVHLWHHNCKGCTVYCRFRLTAFQRHLHVVHVLFNFLYMKSVKSVYCAVIKDILFTGSYSGLSSAYHCIFTTFHKESWHCTRSGRIPMQNNMAGVIDFFHSNVARTQIWRA